MAKKRTKKEKSVSVSTKLNGLNEIEMKLLRLALDKGAYEGEADNAAIMLIRKLRQRDVKAEQLFSQSFSQSSQSSQSSCGIGNEKMTFGKYKNVMIRNVPMNYLVWVLNNCTNIDANLKRAIHKFLTRT